MFNFGARCICLLAQAADLDRNVPPAVDIIPQAQNFGFYNRTAALLCAKVRARQENLADSNQLVHVWLVACAADLIIKEIRRDLDMNARAVAGLAVSVYSPSVPDRLKRGDTVVHNLAVRFAIE